MYHLNADDYDLLMEALNALEKKAASDDLIGLSLGMLFSRSETEARQRVEAMTQQREDREAEQRVITERVILLKAKLIQMKQEAVQQAFAEAIRKDDQD